MTNNKPKILERSQILPIISVLNNGLNQDSLNAVETLITDFPDNAFLFNLRGTCYENLGYLDKSADNFEKAVAILPNYLKAQYNLGVIQGKLCQINSSIKSYKKVIEIKPTHLDARNNLGNALIQNLKFDEAELESVEAELESVE
jgi:tetratricopeptide (TPR) repeat protein